MMANQDTNLKNGKPQRGNRFALSPINQRRKANFKKNRRGYWAMWIFMVLFLVTLAAEFLANDRPIVASIDGKTLYPIFIDYEENDILEEDPFNLPVTDFRAPHIEEAFRVKQGWMIWPPIRYSYRTINKQLPEPAPAKPFWLYDIDERCNAYLSGVNDIGCNIGNWNWLGTDDQGRDVLARIIYGFRISILFGLILTLASAVIGVSAGAIQGYFGGWVDLIFQRIIEIWSAMPLLYLLLIVASILEPGFWILLGIMLMFSWVSFVGVVRAEFYRARNLEYVKAARALGVGNITIMLRHMLPNAMVATLTFLPFILSGSITTLTSLDFLGFGLPPGSASLGELLQQGKNNLESPWLGISGFIVISLMLSLLVFIGEATRDAFDPRKTFE
ncbi:MAG: ABC transporter permease [Hyphomicrobiales bacterium]|nr:ABC transporter permease [Hyphomicrobiales bacterium]